MGARLGRLPTVEFEPVTHVKSHGRVSCHDETISPTTSLLSGFSKKQKMHF
jgi:hypothetical protein